MILYCTADEVGTPTGGGLVTAQESQALREFSAQRLRETFDTSYSSVEVWSRANLGSTQPEPWKWDEVAASKAANMVEAPKLAHFYSGSFPRTVAILKARGCQVSYTIAAHDREVSRKEHAKLGYAFPYPHLTEDHLWQKYIDGYRLADVIICPSTVAERTVRGYGPEFGAKEIRIVPHGCYLPDQVKPLPKVFTLGYMGAISPDKGSVYLLEAWKSLGYTDGSFLVLAGKDSLTNHCKQLLNRYGGGNVFLAGWQKNISEFYNSLSCYIQPSATEGFGIEVLEAASYQRPIICSRNAGAVDVVHDFDWGLSAEPCSAKSLVDGIEVIKDSIATGDPCIGEWQAKAAKAAENHTWDKIRTRYQQVWREMVQ